MPFHHGIPLAKGVCTAFVSPDSAFVAYIRDVAIAGHDPIAVVQFQGKIAAVIATAAP